MNATGSEQSHQDPLEDLRRLVNASIDTVQQDLERHNDPPLEIWSTRRHPLRDRYDPRTAHAIKCISSAGMMLRVLCDPEAWTHDVLFNFHDLTALFVVCQADVANVLRDGPLSAEEVAAATGIEADKISRHLRALCNLYIFREIAPDVFCNNELSIQFQSASKRALVGLNAEESRNSSCKAWEALTLESFKNSDAPDKAAFNIAYQTELNVFQWWQKVRPDLGARGALAFTGKGINYDAYVSLYPWGKELDGALLVDVGGGAGGATLPILKRFKHLKLQIQDLVGNEPHLEKDYPDVYQAGRASFVEHDFFCEQPAKGAQLYFLRHVIHDWLDPEACKILSRIAAAMTSSSKLLICEHIVLPSFPQPDQSGLKDDVLSAPAPLLPNWGASFTSRLDLQVLAVLNARQRTEDEFAKLVAAAGLVISNVWRNMGDETIVECRLG
ncbi:hypothetical protein NLG97_g1741 [Lecanicillium saksenae]|uniref:Uncharacterized protein n=1 Tax=Lecanicillium saksenae TaxID=468837 RepID=A0ACC1R677_9HYPO|nr:hypothetical protein NLG97_g1741 [Lecanicillium saksenae]